MGIEEYMLGTYIIAVKLSYTGQKLTYFENLALL